VRDIIPPTSLVPIEKPADRPSFTAAVWGFLSLEFLRFKGGKSTSDFYGLNIEEKKKTNS
jgi:hypothetical protein